MYTLVKPVAWAALIVVACWWAWQGAILPIWNDEFVTLIQISGRMTPTHVLWPPVPFDVDALQAMTAGPTNPGLLTQTLKLWDVHPPVYYHLASRWSDVVGDGVGQVRALSVLCVALAVGVVLWAAWRRDGAYALLGLAALLISPSVAMAAVNARGYGLGLLCVAVCMAASVCAAKAARPDRWVGLASGAAALGLCVHYFTVLFTAPALLVLAMGLGFRAWRGIGVGVGLVGIAVVLVWPFLSVQMGARPHQFGGFLGPLPEALLLLRVAVGQWSSLPTAWPWMWPVVLLVGLAWMGVLIVVGACRRPRDLGLLVLVASVCGGYTALWALFWATDKSLASFDAARYGLFSLPALALLASGVGARLCGGSRVALAGGVVATLAFGGLSWVDATKLGLPWAIQDDVEQARATLIDLAGENPAEGLVIFATRDVGFIGARIPLLPQGVGVRFVQGEPALGDVSGIERLVVWSYRSEGFDARQLAALKEAAQAAGFDTSGPVWLKRETRQ